MKKFLSLLLIFSILLASVPAGALAASSDYLIVTRDNAPIRTGPSEDDSIVARCSKGDLLETTGSTLNWRLNHWYKVRYNGSTRYIYSGNVKEHQHDYAKYTYEGVRYAVCCDCGHATVTMTENAKVSKSTAQAMLPHISTGFGIAAADGPIPAGDVLGLIVASVGCLYAMTQPSKALVTEITQDLADYMKRSPRTCSVDSFYAVQRVNGNLIKENNECLTIPEAYARVRAGGDVWTEKQSTAEALAAVYSGGYYSEVDKDKCGYYYHYHLGSNVSNKVKSAGHIFYGASVAYGDRPH